MRRAALVAALVAGGCGDQAAAPPTPTLPGDVVPEWSALSATLLVPRGSVWRYLDDGSDQGTAWRAPGFDDGAWRLGPAQLGYGDGDEATVIRFGPSTSNKFITTYFRRSFVVTNPALYASLTLRVLRDDGAVVYLNGVEVFRSNMPAGAITFRTKALVNTPDEKRFFQVALNAAANPALLQQGTNVLAVEVHQVAGSSSDVSFDAELAGEPLPVQTPPAPARPHVDSYLIHYGAWDAAALATAKRHQLVISHPSRLTRAIVAEIQQGLNAADPADDVKVLCYVSIGEDLRSASVTDDQARGDPRFVGDGSGPRIDPRGPDADGRSLAGIDPRGAPSTGGTQFASFYLDDNSVDRNGVGDGIPDRNTYFNAYFVNAGDPRWFDVVDTMTLDGPDGVAGLREVLTTSTGRGLGCDGVFLDTLDTAAPNHYTDSTSFNQSEFEWTAPGLSSFVRRVRAAYPSRLVAQNRGLFFLDPRHPHYQFTTRGAIDFLMFESFRLDSSPGDLENAYFYPDNRFNVAPKLLAESARAEGFQILSLGFAEGPAGQISRATLVGQSTLGLDTLLEDIRVAQDLTGFRHYLTDASVTLVNSFVRDRADLGDALAPVWTSTFNDHNPGWPTPPGDPTPRAGLREVVAGPQRLVVRWDVALDKFPVGYAVYYRTTPFDFTGDPALQTATRVEVAPEMPPNYPGWGGPAVVANQATLTGLTPGQTYFLVVRAFDRSGAHNEEQNRIVMTGVPTP